MLRAFHSSAFPLRSFKWIAAILLSHFYFNLLPFSIHVMDLSQSLSGAFKYNCTDALQHYQFAHLAKGSDWRISVYMSCINFKAADIG